ncbi:MAG: hypothetical protein JXJ04_04140, partial [Spirochaetales bacterium]|nr:hypothetical protein [Spirochaetales bacterium]
MKYSKILIILIMLSAALFISCPGPGGETEEPQVLPKPGDAWFVPDTIHADQDDLFTTEVHVNTGDVMIGTYAFFIYFDEAV